MTQKLPLLIVNQFHPNTMERLDHLFDSYHLWEYQGDAKEQLLDKLAPICKMAACASWKCDSAVYNLPNLELISCFGVGVDGIDFSRTNAQNIQVTNTPDVLNDAVADLAIALMLGITRQIAQADGFVRAGSWLERPFPLGNSLAGKNLGIAGMGRIGEEIASRAAAFKMKIHYHNRRRRPELPEYQYHEDLIYLADASDVLISVLPGGAETHGIIDAEVFHALGLAGFFVNIGRGSCVNETDLISFLEQKAIAGAALDVYAEEPNVPEKLFALDNVLLLPHLGSATHETRAAMGELVVENIFAHMRGEALLTPVNQ